MKTQSYLLVTSALGLLLTSGCGKTEDLSTPPPPPPAAAPAPPAPAAEVKPAVDAAAAAAERSAAEAQAQAAAAQKAVDSAATAAQAETSAITSKAQSAIDNARQLIADSKWSEALKVLNDLAALKLTPEQQAAVDKLKVQAGELAQKAVATQATEKGTKALGDLLKK